MWLSTFHKFCLEKILTVANPDLKPIEDVDHWILLRRHIAELELDQFKRLADPGEFLSDFLTFFSRCQDELVSCDDFQKHVDELRKSYEKRKKQLEPDAQKQEEEELGRQEEVARVYRVSERLLRERNLITFGAQLMQTVELLRRDKALLERLRAQYRYILVDEFQDTNIAQLELLCLLAGEQRNIVAVGDDDQAIYRFRGASFGSFTIFLKRFCGVSDTKLGGGREEISGFADAELPVDAKDFARGGRGDFEQREIAAAAAEEIEDGESGRRKNSRGGIRDAGRRSALGSVGNRASARTRKSVGGVLRCSTANTRTATGCWKRCGGGGFRSLSRSFRSCRARSCATCWRICG